MSSLEKAELDHFLDQLERIHQIEKVADADAMIKRAITQQLDAAHMLVQRALLLGRALTQAKARIGEFDETADMPVPEANSAPDDYLFV
jgi:hypothetical protein